MLALVQEAEQRNAKHRREVGMVVKVGMWQRDSQLCSQFGRALADRYRAAKFLYLQQNALGEWVSVLNWKTTWKPNTLAMRIIKEYDGDDLELIIDGQGGAWGPPPDLSYLDE